MIFLEVLWAEGFEVEDLNELLEVKIIFYFLINI